MATPHIEVNDKSLFGETVLMPGDPLRAEYIANKFLTDPVKINSVRNMFGFTGYYKGKKITVMASGMGNASIGIYSYELYKFYGVENIIRIGSAGSYREDLKVYDVVLASSAYSESTYAKTAFGYKEHVMKPSKELFNRIKRAAKKVEIPLNVARVHSSDAFYRPKDDAVEVVGKGKNCGCVEMESYALFANARYLNKKAACLLTISDSLVTHEATTSEQRRATLNNMIKIALEVVVTE